MRLLVVAALGISLFVPTQIAAESSSEGDQVKRVLLGQAHLFRQGKFRQEYDTLYTPNFRAHCPWARYLQRQRYGRSITGRNFAVRNIRVRFLSSTKAYLAYRFVRGDGRVVADVRFVDRDLYTKIGTRWLDDWARARDC